MNVHQANPERPIPMLSRALDYARRGVPVFPCHAAPPRAKQPLTAHGVKDASRDEAIIREWWGRWPDAMIGAAMGEPSGLFAVDPDRPKEEGDPDGLAAWNALVAQHGDIPHTHTHETPSGGRHFLFKMPDGVRITNRTGALPKGIDCRGDGGYVIAAPSRMADGRAYKMADLFDFGEFAPAPQWLVDLITADPKRAPEPEPKADPKPEHDGPNPFERHATASSTKRQGSAVEKYVEAAIDAECRTVANSTRPGRNNTLNTAAFSLGTLVGANVLDASRAARVLYEAAAAAGLVREDGQRAVMATIESGLTAGAAKPRDLSDVGAKAKARTQGEQQKASSAGGFEEAGSASSAGEGDPPEDEDDLSRLNREFCVVLDSGKARVLHFETVRQDKHSREVACFLSFDDFRNWHMNFTVEVGKKDVPLGQWWLKNPDRRQYRGLTFEPAAPREINGRLNLWRGWGVEAKAGDWSLMREHIVKVLASGDAASDDYITRWIAWTVQHPAERAQAALVFKGARGTGKGTLGNALCRIFGQHGTHISTAEHLAGRFNGHLRDACFLFADEAYWPGDKGAEGSLKRLVTEPDLFIEAKGKDGVTVPNMLHVMMASNDAWVVPAGEDERRYAVFDVSDCHKQDETWFGPLNAQMEAGGYEAMLHDLSRMDLGDWHPRRVIRTEALVEQQSRGLGPEDSWWCELLQTGVLWGADPRRPSCAVSNGYEEEKETFGGTRTIKRRCLYDQAREVSPRLRGASDHLLGRMLIGFGCSNDHRVLRRRGWQFPDLADARRVWEGRFPGWKWHEPNLSNWKEPPDADA